MGTILACSTVPYEAHPLERALSGIAGAGFRNVLVGPAHAGLPVLDLAGGRSGASRLGEALKRSGLAALALAPELPLVDDDSEEALGVVLELAKSIGARQVWLSGPEAFGQSGELKPEAEWRRELREFASRMGRLGAKAGSMGLELLLQTEPRVSGCAADLEALLELVGGSPALAYNPGLVSYYSGANPLRDLEAVRARIGALCLRDHKGAQGEAEFPALGAGDVDYLAIRDLLAARGPLPPVVVEHLPGSSPEELDRSAAAAFRFASMLFR